MSPNVHLTQIWQRVTRRWTMTLRVAACRRIVLAHAGTDMR
jgi:hypothetical protein